MCFVSTEKIFISVIRTEASCLVKIHRVAYLLVFWCWSATICQKVEMSVHQQDVALKYVTNWSIQTLNLKSTVQIWFSSLQRTRVSCSFQFHFTIINAPTFPPRPSIQTEFAVVCRIFCVSNQVFSFANWKLA